jgi:hypothetical protein
MDKGYSTEPCQCVKEVAVTPSGQQRTLIFYQLWPFTV